MSKQASVFRIPPYFFIHVLDNNTNVTKVEVGPQTFTRQDHIKVVKGPEKMITVPPRHYCVIQNPIQRGEGGAPVTDSFGQFKLRFGDQEVRLQQEPFPLFPGEELAGSVTPLKVVEQSTALRLRAIRDFTDSAGVNRTAGEEWLFEGPGTYSPHVCVQDVETIISTIVKPNQALQLRARKKTTDRTGKARLAGEEWLVRNEGSYLPGVDEEVVRTLTAHVLTDKKAIHLRATRTFTDIFGKTRKAGEEWLVTLTDAEMYINDVYEEVVGQANIVTLNNRQFCVILDPVGGDGKQQFGRRELRVGERSFFLQPGEKLESGIQSVFVLGEEEALVLRARERIEDTQVVEGKTVPVVRSPGDLWMIYGPTDYFPPVQVEIVDKRKSIPLDENEGIYVRDIKTGRVRAIQGESYMLREYEELWAKELPSGVEDLLKSTLDPLADRADRSGGRSSSAARDKTRVVTFRVPHNAAVQIYDYKNKQARVIFGPDLVMLGPDEQFTQMSLSGDKPKRPNIIKSLVLLLGPDFMTDIVTVETSDHARLSLQLSYNWHFDVDRKNSAEAASIFNIPDFVGDACKAIASRVRGAVAAVPFDAFHKNSARIIRTSLFGIDENGKVCDRFKFRSNNLCITSIDIQSVEPVDQRTRDALQKSVQLAIEITTKSQEAAARHEAERIEQEARGRLERQKIEDQAKAEESRKDLLELQAQSAAVEATGQATAEARARAQAAQIEGEAAVKQAELKSKASTIESKGELERLKAHQDAELKHQRELNGLEITKASELAAIETKKFKETVEAIGRDTILAMAQAGPEMQAKLLAGLGLKGYLVTDGNSPINLFNTANGLLGGGAAGEE